jgi:hypothetical protein
MKNLLWSVVLIFALSFVFLACGGDEGEDPEYLGALSIDMPVGGAWTGGTLTAEYTPIATGTNDTVENLTFTWKVNGTTVHSGLGEDTCTATTVPGRYTVTVSLEGYEDTTSAAIVVVPTIFRSTTWTASYTDSGSWVETVTFPYDNDAPLFSLTSNRTATAPASGTEYFKFTITNLEVVNPIPTLTASQDSTINTWAVAGYKLTGTTDHVGYSVLTAFSIYIDNATSPTKFARTQGNTNTIINRGTANYTKQ